jgi:O-antigen/teichoic acid export membrane protein
VEINGLNQKSAPALPAQSGGGSVLEPQYLQAEAHTIVTEVLPRLRHSVAWSLAGNLTYALSQWALLASVSKLGGAQMVGELALSLAITSPIFLLTNLQLSTVQTTDTFDRFTFGDYLSLRLASTVAALVLIFLILGFWPQSKTTAGVTLLIAGSKALDSVSDVIYGYFRKHERMDLITISQVIKSAVSTVAFTVALMLSSRLTWAAGALALSGLATLVTYDFPMLKRAARGARAAEPQRFAPHWSTKASSRLIMTTLPLGVSAMLVSLNTNIPRYFIGHSLGERSLGYFAGTAYITMAGTFVVSAVAQAVLPRLALYYKTGDFRSLKAVLYRLSAMAVAVGGAGVILSAVAGPQLLSIIYRPEYAPYGNLLTLLAVSATVAYLASILNCAMNAVHQFRQQLPLFIATSAATGLACLILIPKYGLYGAALGMTVGFGLQLGGATLIVASALRSRVEMI